MFRRFIIPPAVITSSSNHDNRKRCHARRFGPALVEALERRWLLSADPLQAGHPMGTASTELSTTFLSAKRSQDTASATPLAVSAGGGITGASGGGTVGTAGGGTTPESVYRVTPLSTANLPGTKFDTETSIAGQIRCGKGVAPVDVWFSNGQVNAVIPPLATRTGTLRKGRATLTVTGASGASQTFVLQVAAYPHPKTIAGATSQFLQGVQAQVQSAISELPSSPFNTTVNQQSLAASLQKLELLISDVSALQNHAHRRVLLAGTGAASIWITPATIRASDALLTPVVAQAQSAAVGRAIARPSTSGGIGQTFSITGTLVAGIALLGALALDATTAVAIETVGTVGLALSASIMVGAGIAAAVAYGTGHGADAAELGKEALQGAFDILTGLVTKIPILQKLEIDAAMIDLANKFGLMTPGTQPTRPPTSPPHPLGEFYVFQDDNWPDNNWLTLEVSTLVGSGLDYLLNQYSMSWSSLHVQSSQFDETGRATITFTVDQVIAGEPGAGFTGIFDAILGTITGVWTDGSARISDVFKLSGYGG